MQPSMWDGVTLTSVLWMLGAAVCIAMAYTMSKRDEQNLARFFRAFVAVALFEAFMVVAICVGTAHWTK